MPLGRLPTPPNAEGISRSAASAARTGTVLIPDAAGHVSRAMLSRYSHVRMEAKRRTLDEIAAPTRESLQIPTIAGPVGALGAGYFAGNNCFMNSWSSRTARRRCPRPGCGDVDASNRSEEHTSELQS